MDEFKTLFDNPVKSLSLEMQYKSSDTAIDIKKIFRTILNDPQFLSQQFEEEEVEKVKKKQDLLHQISGKYQLLAISQKELASNFPSSFTNLITSPNCYRFGIQRTQAGGDNKNISFLTSLNILLYPELTKEKYGVLYSANDQLLSHLIERIKRNYRIDRVKNTKDMQKMNLKVIELLQAGTIVPQMMQYVADIFEVNILVFDFNASSTELYWPIAEQFPYFNLYKKLLVFYRDKDFFEPIINKSSWGTTKIYPRLLININDLVCHRKVKLSLLQYEQLSNADFAVSDMDFAMISLHCPLDLELPPGIIAPKQQMVRKRSFKKFQRKY